MPPQMPPVVVEIVEGSIEENAPYMSPMNNVVMVFWLFLCVRVLT